MWGFAIPVWPLCGLGQALQHVVLSAGISMSGMKPGLCGLTWALRTMDGRFWMPPLRKEAKVTNPLSGAPLLWVWL